MTNETTTTAPNLAQKIAAARNKLGSLKADKTNKDQNYQYISADKMLERGGDVLAEFGIAIIPSVTETVITPVDRQGKSPRLDAQLKMSFRVTDGLTEYLAEWVGCGSDYVTSDKAVYKAITSGHKYFLMKLLNVGVGNEDGEHENGDKESGAKSAATKQEPAPAPAKVEPVAVTINQAIIDAEMSSDGVTLYTSIPTPKLANMGNAMLKKLNAGEYTADELVEKSRKLAVIDAILIKRQEAGQ